MLYGHCDDISLSCFTPFKMCTLHIPHIPLQGLFLQGQISVSISHWKTPWNGKLLDVRDAVVTFQHSINHYDSVVEMIDFMLFSSRLRWVLWLRGAFRDDDASHKGLLLLINYAGQNDVMMMTIIMKVISSNSGYISRNVSYQWVLNCTLVC